MASKLTQRKCGCGQTTHLVKIDGKIRYDQVVHGSNAEANGKCFNCGVLFDKPQPAAAVNKELAEAKAKIETLQKALDESSEPGDELQKALDESLAKGDELQKALDESLAKIDALEKTVAEKAEYITGLQKQLDEAKAKNPDLFNN